MENALFSEKIFTTVQKLPPMPENIGELRKLAGSADSTYANIVAIIEKDPALCADLLHLVNSAWFGLNHRVERISEATRLLGMGGIADFASTAFSQRTFHNTFADIPNLADYFEHSRQVSVAAKIIAVLTHRSHEDQEVLAVAGLLHDMGRLAILLAADPELRTLLGNDFKYVDGIHLREEELLGLNHCIVGREISKKWNFSDNIQNSILFHHAPETPAGFNVDAAIILLAHFVSMTDFPVQLLLTVFDKPTLDKTGLTDETLELARNEFIKAMAKAV